MSRSLFRIFKLLMVIELISSHGPPFTMSTEAALRCRRFDFAFGDSADSVSRHQRAGFSLPQESVGPNETEMGTDCTMNADIDGDIRVSADLFLKAKREGMVRVIVELQIPAGSEDTREQRIREVQRRVLLELSAASHTLVRSFSVVPTIVLDVSDGALQILARSSDVLTVNEDGVAAPLNTPVPPYQTPPEKSGQSRGDQC